MEEEEEVSFVSMLFLVSISGFDLDCARFLPFANEDTAIDDTAIDGGGDELFCLAVL